MIQTIQKTAEQTSQNLQKMQDEINQFTTGLVDASLKSVTAATKGCDEVSRSAGAMLQENMARLMNVSKTASALKSPSDILTLQQEFAKDCLDLWMASATKLAEISARTVKDVVEPVAEHTSSAVSRFMQKARAAA